MYRVRLPTGDEKTYLSIEEMAWDVELGVITPDAQMFHSASKTWVSIARHPQLGSRFMDTGESQEVALEFDLLSDDEIESLAPKPAEPPSPPPSLGIVADLAAEAAGQHPLVSPPPPAAAAEFVAPAEQLVKEPEPVIEASPESAVGLASAGEVLREPPASPPRIGTIADLAVEAAGQEPLVSPPPPPEIVAPAEQLVKEPEPVIEASPESAVGLASAQEMLLEPPAPTRAELEPLSEVPVYTELPSPPAPLSPSSPTPRARRQSRRENPPDPSSYLPEPSLDGDLEPLPDDGQQTWSTDYKPLEWKPEPRFRGLALIGAAVAAVAAVATAGYFGLQWWESRHGAVSDSEVIVTVNDTAAARQAVDSVTDSALTAALATLAVAETVGLGPQRAPTRAEPLVTGRRPVEGLRPITPTELRRSYAEAYANARTDMDSDLGLAGVIRLLSNPRLSSRDSLRSGRRLITSAKNIVRVFHSYEVQIERAFRDTVTFQVNKMGWSRSQQADWKSRATLKESYEGAQLSDSLLMQMDVLYALLLGRWGDYDLSGSRIVFDDPQAAEDYDKIAKWLNRTIARLDTGSESTTAPTARRLVRGLGGTRPPALQHSRVPD